MCFIMGILPQRMCRSEPQTAAAVTRWIGVVVGVDRRVGHLLDAHVVGAPVGQSQPPGLGVVALSAPAALRRSVGGYSELPLPVICRSPRWKTPTPCGHRALSAAVRCALEVREPVRAQISAAARSASRQRRRGIHVARRAQTTRGLRRRACTASSSARGKTRVRSSR